MKCFVFFFLKISLLPVLHQNVSSLRARTAIMLATHLSPIPRIAASIREKAQGLFSEWTNESII